MAHVHEKLAVAAVVPNDVHTTAYTETGNQTSMTLNIGTNQWANFKSRGISARSIKWVVHNLVPMVIGGLYLAP